MNRDFRIIWSHARQSWTVVGEAAKAQGKRKTLRASAPTSLFSFASAATLALSLSLSNFTLAAPQLNTIQQGIGSVSRQGDTLSIHQSSQQLNLEWNQFNIAQHETVEFIQPSRESLAINHILDTNGSRIQGSLKANGQVWLLNPNGIVFGKSARVNVGGLLASSLSELELTDGKAWLKKSYTSSTIENHGVITAAEGGYVAFVGERVENNGQLNASGGTVALAAGSEVNITFADQQLFSLEVSQSTLNNTAANHGMITAEGGRVVMNAGAKHSLLASVVNNGGVIEANSVIKAKGEIILLSGMVAGITEVAGRLDTSAKNTDDGDSEADVGGGFIETSGRVVNISDDAVVTTFSQADSGVWLIDPEDYIIAADGVKNQTGAQLSASLGLGDVIIASPAGTGNGDIFVNDSVSWSSNNNLTLSAGGDIYVNHQITASGATAKVILQYGLENLNSGNTARYHVNAAVNLQAGDNFSTQLGSDGGVVEYKVITELGLEGSETGADLQGIAGDRGLDDDPIRGGDYALGANIDASTTSSWSGGEGFDPIGDYSAADQRRFLGRLNGLGHTVDSLYINRPTERYIGLFGVVSQGSEILNLGLTNVDITGGDNVGSIAGYFRALPNFGGSTPDLVEDDGNGYPQPVAVLPQPQVILFNSYATGSVTGASGTGTLGDFVGGLVGASLGGRIELSYADVEVSTSAVGESLGGLLGHSGESVILNSYSTGDVTGADYLGGLVGYANKSIITNSFASGSVTITATAATAPSAGGLVGWLQDGSYIENSYSTSSVNADDGYGGGLVGKGTDSPSTIINSYSNGAVTGSVGIALGGLIGDSIGMLVENSYWDTQTSGQATSSGGYGSGKTTAELLDYDTFKDDWGIDEVGGSTNVWRMYDGHSTPLLRNLLKPSDSVVAGESFATLAIYDGTAQGHTLKSGVFALGSLSDTEKTNAGNYKLSDIAGFDLYSNQMGYDIKSDALLLTINAKDIQLSRNKTYDGSSSLSLSQLNITGLVASDQLNLTGSVQSTAKNAGSYSIDVSGVSVGNSNYKLASSGHSVTISPRSVELSLVGDYGDVVDVSLAAISSSGLIGGDQLNLSGSVPLSSTSVGSYTLDTSNLTIGNTNYQMASAGHNITINPRALTLNTSRIYDGSTSLLLSSINITGVLDNELLSLSGAVSLESADAGVNEINVSDLVLDNGNYRLASTGHKATILAKTIELNSQRAYDGSTVISLASIQSAGLIGSDSLALSGSAQVAAKDVGEYNINVSNLTLGNNNYQLAANGHTALISEKEIQLSAERIYDGSTDLSLDFLTSDGLVAGDQLGLTGATQLLTQDAGLQVINISGVSLGNSNYQLAGDGHTANIIPKAVQLTASREYDGSNSLALSLLLSDGLIAGDSLDLSGQASISNKSAGDHLINTESLIIGNQNYEIESGSSASIEQKLIVPEVIAEDKDFDENFDVVIEILPLQGVIGGDQLMVEYDTALFTSTVGVNIPVVVDGVRLSGVDAINYRLSSSVLETYASITDVIDAQNVTQALVSNVVQTSQLVASNEVSPVTTPGSSLNDGPQSSALSTEVAESAGAEQATEPSRNESEPEAVPTEEPGRTLALQSVETEDFSVSPEEASVEERCPSTVADSQSSGGSSWMGGVQVSIDGGGVGRGC